MPVLRRMMKWWSGRGRLWNLGRLLASGEKSDHSYRSSRAPGYLHRQCDHRETGVWQRVEISQVLKSWHLMFRGEAIGLGTLVDSHFDGAHDRRSPLRKRASDPKFRVKDYTPNQLRVTHVEESGMEVIAINLTQSQNHPSVRAFRVWWACSRSYRGWKIKRTE
jgi:hypothetical protein